MNRQQNQTITIVSGLPRSGTSMMMQILNAGGLEILTDKKREQDNNNPKGYYEFEKVKGLANTKDCSWVKLGVGKVIKVIAQLLQYLPQQYYYKVIFMHRDIKEVMKSQQKMLGQKDDDYPEAVITVYEEDVKNAVAWAKQQEHVELLEVNHIDVINHTDAVVKIINEFLGGRMDVDAMRSVVDPKLYRNRTK